MVNTYQRETKEFIPVPISINGVSTTVGVKFQITILGARPIGVWLDPITVGGKIGVMIDQLAPGKWTIWAQVTSNPEIVVEDCGFFLVR